jgi:hypothetical protein
LFSAVSLSGILETSKIHNSAEPRKEQKFMSDQPLVQYGQTFSETVFRKRLKAHWETKIDKRKYVWLSCRLQYAISVHEDESSGHDNSRINCQRVRYSWILRKPMIQHGTLTCYIICHNYISGQVSRSWSLLSSITVSSEGRISTRREIAVGTREGSGHALLLYNVYAHKVSMAPAINLDMFADDNLYVHVLSKLQRSSRPMSPCSSKQVYSLMKLSSGSQRPVVGLHDL